jgi:hypothetical protein
MSFLFWTSAVQLPPRRGGRLFVTRVIFCDVQQNLVFFDVIEWLGDSESVSNLFVQFCQAQNQESGAIVQ